MKKPLITMVAAVAENGVIGRDNDLPWRLSDDLKRFKAITMGKPLVLGRKNFQSFGGRVLPGRPHIVVTRDTSYSHENENVFVVHSLEEALEKARELAAQNGAEEIIIGGGGEIYRQAMDVADRLDITHVEATVWGDVHFPPIEREIWVGTEEGSVDAGEKNDHSYRYVSYVRR